MRDNALYFPYINMPNSAWFFKILLYWDKVSSIVPSEYIHNPQDLQNHMRELVSAELVNQIFPAEYIYGNQRFENNFISYVQNGINKRNKLQAVYGKMAKLTQPIHLEKLGNLATKLVKLKVARANNYPWFDVDEWVANSFMAYLASVLGANEQINAAPVTNMIKSFQVLGGLRPSWAPKSTIPQTRRQTREVIIKNLLPAPNGPVSIREVVDFKSKHGHLLPRLRNMVEARCIEIAQISDQQTRQDRIDLLLSEFEIEIGDIAEAMRSKWKNIVFKSLVPLITGSAAVTSVVTGNPGIQSIATNIVAGGTLTSAIQSTIGGNNTNPGLTNRPLAYAAYVRSNFSKN